MAKEYYRLNVNLPLDLAERLKAYSEKTGVSMVGCVSLSLSSYLDEQERRLVLMEQFSNPKTLASILVEMGISDSNITEILLNSRDVKL